LVKISNLKIHIEESRLKLPGYLSRLLLESFRKKNRRISIVTWVPTKKNKKKRKKGGGAAFFFLQWHSSNYQSSQILLELAKSAQEVFGANKIRFLKAEASTAF